MNRRTGLIVLTVLFTSLAVNTWLPPMTEFAWASSPTLEGKSSSPSTALQMPPFLEAGGATLAQQGSISDYFAGGVAGIAAYTNMGKDINIDKLAKSDIFQTVENIQPGDYVIGTVRPTGFKDNKNLNASMDVHIFAQREGWVVSYLLPEQPTSRIVDWAKYSEAKLETTTLEDAIQQVARYGGATLGDIGYYHFGHPDATNLMLVAGILQDGNLAHTSFNIKIPSAFTLYESSYVNAALGAYNSICSLNGQTLDDRVGSGGADNHFWDIKAYPINDSAWKTNQSNEVAIDRGGTYSGYMLGCAIAIVYGAPE